MRGGRKSRNISWTSRRYIGWGGNGSRSRNNSWIISTTVGVAVVVEIGITVEHEVATSVGVSVG